MRIINDLEATTEYRGGVVALGTFDGMHLGHQRVVETATLEARRRGAAALVLTFSNHPLSVLAPSRAPLLLETEAQRREQLRGADCLIELPFTRELASQTPAEWVAMLRRALRPCCVVTGYNYTFGIRGEGTAATLKELGAQFGFDAIACPAVTVDGVAVSSTAIREAVQRGDIATANAMLGRPFSLCGAVGHGEERGRTLGFPTANLALPAATYAAPPDGAYAVEASVNGERHLGVANVGSNPTFGGHRRRLEVHLLDYRGDLYGETLNVGFVERLRGEKTFAGVEELRARLLADVEKARKIFAAHR